MSAGSGGQNTVSQSSSPPQTFLNAYEQLLPQVQQTAATPYQQYQGPLVAGFSPDQASGISATQQAQGVANPFINAASQHLTDATAPLWPGVQQFSPENVQQYESPYTHDVLDATIAAENNQDAQQQQTLAGQAIGKGAWGGDRAGVAQGILGGQQAIANNATNAGILNQGYGQALGELNTQQSAQLGANEANAWLNSQAGAGLANLGNEALNTSLTGANALLSTGSLEQQLAQENLNVPYQQFLAAQAYPFQTTGWEQGLLTNLGSSAGGTGTTVSPGASPISQIAGLGIGTAGLAGAANSTGLSGYLSSLFGGGSGLSGAGAVGSIGAGLGSLGLDSAAAAGSIGAGSSLAAAFPLIFERGGIVPFPARRRGGLVPANDDGWEPIAHRAAGGIAPMLPESTPAIAGAAPMIRGGIGAPMGVLPPAITSYLDANGANAPLKIYQPPSLPSAPAAAAPSGAGMALNALGEPSQGVTDWLADEESRLQNYNAAGTSGARGGIVPFARRGDGGPLASLLSANPEDYTTAHPQESAPEESLPLPPDYVPPPPPRGGIGGHAFQRPAGPPMAPPPASTQSDYPAGGIQGGLDAVSRLSGRGSAADHIATPPSGASPWLSLADAGFSMAAGRSPHALENIAAGAHQGVQEFVKADQAARQLSVQAEEAKARLADTDAWHQATVANTANRNETYAQAAANRHQDAQDKMMNALALASARAGAHATSGDLMSEAINSMKGQVNPDTGQPYTQMELFHIANGLATKTAQTDRKLDQTDRQLGQRDTSLKQGQQRIDLGAANNAQRAQARANGEEDAGALKIMNAQALAGKPMDYNTALLLHRRTQTAAGNATVPKAAPPSGGTSTPPQYTEGQIYVDGKGTRAIYQNGQFQPAP